MDIQKIQERFEDLMLANPDFDESLLEKDEEGCYVDSDIADMYSMFEAGAEVGEAWQAAKLSVPEGFVLVPKVPTKDTLIGIASVCIGDDFANLDEAKELYKAMVEAQEPSNDS